MICSSSALRPHLPSAARSTWHHPLRRPAVVAAVVTAFMGAWGIAPAFGQYDAPTTYYSSVTTQTGQTLKDQLQTVMTTGQNPTSYAEVRDYLPFTDQNPDNAAQMFEFYTRATIAKTATTVGFINAYDSREHVWPDSLQGSGTATGGSDGSRNDIHMLKPLDNTVNNARSNLPYGGTAAGASSTKYGDAGTTGTGYWYPGGADKGDAARILFYAATRYQGQMSLKNGLPTGSNTMGDLDAVMHYHYQDVPDLFERRRNDVIYRGDDVRTTGDDSAFGGTNNRNAFIDHPEYAWSVFVNQTNDTQLSVGTPGTNGGSTATADFGRVLRNAAVPTGTKSVTLSKAGVNGTYYSVTAAGSATSSVSGRYNAFTMDTTGSRTLAVGLATTTSTATVGLKSGTVTIDNLDVTPGSGGGVGHGANDADDVITAQMAVLDASNSSFGAAGSGAGGANKSLSLDFGKVNRGSAAGSLPFSITNVSSPFGAALTAGLDLDGITPGGDATRFTTSPTAFTNLPAGDAKAFAATFDTSTVGNFTATYTLQFSDEDLPGTVSTSSLLLTLHGIVEVPEPGSAIIVLAFGLAATTVRRRRSPAVA
ncbi:MAG: putative ribonuclease [Phycisphaerales bacterium]|nr:putative ribonuclease [Phycisphaerales bacterium]